MSDFITFCKHVIYIGGLETFRPPSTPPTEGFDMVRRDGLALVCLFRVDFFGFLSGSLLGFLGLLGGIVTSSATIFVALTWWGSSSVAAAFAGWDGAVSPLSGVSRVVGVLGSLGVVDCWRTRTLVRDCGGPVSAVGRRLVVVVDQ